MRQLSGLDTSFLNMETPTTFGHVASLMLMDPSTANTRDLFGDMKKLFAKRMHLVPPYRWRLAQVPLGLDFPYWFEDPDFDLDFHFRHIAVPPPGTREQLGELIADLHARPIDRTRPLWELYVIEGIEGGLVAQYSKMQHAAIDGVSGANAATLMLDLSPEGDPVPPPAKPWRPEREPTQIELFLRGALNLSLQPARALQWQYRALRALPGMRQLLPSVRDVRARVFGPREGEVLERPSLLAPRTPFNSPLTAHRRFAFGTTPLADVKSIKNAFGTTVNDVVMAVCGGTLRRWLEDHKELPDEPLLAMVPVSVRSEKEMNDYGNRVSAMIASVGTHLADPVERLRHCQEAMKSAKETHQAVPAELLMDATQLLPPAVAALASRTVSRTRLADYVTLPFNVVISNVPGPRETLYCVGAELISSYPVSAIADGAGLNMTVTSYKDRLDFGFLVCRELVPDVWRMVDYFEDSVQELLSAANARA